MLFSLGAKGVVNDYPHSSHVDNSIRWPQSDRLLIAVLHLLRDRDGWNTATRWNDSVVFDTNSLSIAERIWICNFTKVKPSSLNATHRVKRSPLKSSVISPKNQIKLPILRAQTQNRIELEASTLKLLIVDAVISNVWVRALRLGHSIPQSFHSQVPATKPLCW